MREHQVFDSGELAVALSHYDLGVIESITVLQRGSSQSPKVGLVCERGKFVLKRRSGVAVSSDRIELSHRVGDHLRLRGLPVPQVIRLRYSPQRALELRDAVYELYEFIPGHSFDRSPGEAGAAGAMLARFHLESGDFRPPAPLTFPRGDYHDAPGVRDGLRSIASAISSHDSIAGNELELVELTAALAAMYDRAAATANDIGVAQWPRQVIHSDWHPGNLLFRDRAVVGLLDLDSVREGVAMLDVANGSLQYSMIGGGEPENWPDHLDENRFDAFLAAYEKQFPLSVEERRSLPHLLTEALIAECVPRIAQTGSVGRWSGFRVMKMIRRKLDWVRANEDRLGAMPG